MSLQASPEQTGIVFLYSLFCAVVAEEATQAEIKKIAKTGIKNLIFSPYLFSSWAQAQPLPLLQVFDFEMQVSPQGLDFAEHRLQQVFDDALTGTERTGDIARSAARTNAFMIPSFREEPC